MKYLSVQYNKTVCIINCRFFSATCYKYVDDELSDSNSEITVVSDRAVDSNTSDAKNELDENKKRFDHYYDESNKTRKDVKTTTRELNKVLDKKLSALSPEQKLEYSRISEDEIYKTSENHKIVRSCSTNVTKIKYIELSDLATHKQISRSRSLAEYIINALGHTFTPQDKARLENTLEAQRNLARDLTTLRKNVSNLDKAQNSLKKVLKEQLGYTRVDDTNIGESSRGVKRNREALLNEENTIKRQEIAGSNRSNQSLLDDFADPSGEMPDYFSGDD